MFSNETKNTILLNGRTKFRVLLQLKNGTDLNQKIGENEIEDILGLYPSPQNDPNAAHIMLFKFRGNWKLSYDLTYNLKKAKDTLERAKKELKNSELYLNAKKSRIFINILFNATKLSILSLLILHNTKLTFKIKYNQLDQLFSDYAKIGNIDTKFSEYFKKLYSMKKKYKNQNQDKDKEYFDNLNINSDILKTAKELITFTEDTFKSTYFYRQTPSGTYI